jgi:hypothetical protein
MPYATWQTLLPDVPENLQFSSWLYWSDQAVLEALVQEAHDEAVRRRASAS